jgi:hypothetical protein
LLHSVHFIQCNHLICCVPFIHFIHFICFIHFIQFIQSFSNQFPNLFYVILKEVSDRTFWSNRNLHLIGVEGRRRNVR